MSDVTETDLLTKKLLIRQYTLETDIHPFVAGVAFATVWRNRIRSREKVPDTFWELAPWIT